MGGWNGRSRRRFRDRVRKRDGDNCYICGRPTDPELDGEGNNPMSPTLEHVIPTSLGGNRSMANSKLAHGHCNYAKADKLVVCQSYLSGLTPISQFDPRSLTSLTCSSMSESQYQRKLRNSHPSRQGREGFTKPQEPEDLAMQVSPDPGTPFLLARSAGSVARHPATRR